MNKEEMKRIKLVRSREYYTYQINLRIVPASVKKDSLHDIFNKAVLYVYNWLKIRLDLGDVDIEKETSNSFKDLVEYIRDIPDIKGYKTFNVEKLGEGNSFKNKNEYNINVLYLPEEKNWALRVKEVDNLRDFKGEDGEIASNVVFGRTFITDIAVREADTYVSFVARCAVREPFDTAELCNVVRLEFVDDLFNDDSLILNGHYNLYDEIGADLLHYDNFKDRLQEYPQLFNIKDVTGNDVKELLGYYLKEPKDGEIVNISSKFVCQCSVPFIFIPKDILVSFEAFNDLKKELMGYAIVVDLSESVFNKIKGHGDRGIYSDDGKKVEYGDIFYIDHRGKLNILFVADDVVEYRLNKIQKRVLEFSNYTRDRYYSNEPDTLYLKELKVRKFSYDYLDQKVGYSDEKMNEHLLDQQDSIATLEEEKDYLKSELESWDSWKELSEKETPDHIQDQLQELSVWKSLKNKKEGRLEPADIRKQLEEYDRLKKLDLEKESKDSTNVDEDNTWEGLPEKNLDVIDWIEKNYSDTIILHDDAKKAFKNYNSIITGNIDKFCGLISSISIWVMYKRGQIAPDVYKTLKSNKYIEPENVGKESDYKKNAPVYFVKHNGSVHFLNLHMKYSGNCAESIRIYLYFDDIDKKAVIGSMPDHLWTSNYPQNRRNKS